MRSFKIVLLGLFITLCNPAWAKGDMGPQIEEGKLWTLSYNENPFWQNEKFAWVEQNTKLRFVQPQFTIGTLKLGETLVEIKDGKVQALSISLYNKGDNKSSSEKLSRDGFMNKIKDSKEALDKVMGAKGKNYQPPITMTAVRLQGYSWQNEHTVLLLEYSISNTSVKNFLGEFIRLSIVPASMAGEVLVDSSSRRPKSEPLKKSEVKKNVIKEEDGSVYIKGIPMVDQGSKGYCSVATTARVLGYYGFDNVDMHEIAQLSNTKVGGGTYSEDMVKNVGKILPGRYGLSISNNLYKLDFFDLIKKYNRGAKKAKQQEINVLGGGVIDMGTVWRSFSPDVLLEVRTGNKAQVDKWTKIVTTYIDQGIPILWGLMLGTFNENNLQQTSGGHMRLIIGYNLDTQEILFSDSWGAGHELKRMPLKQAMASTLDMYVIMPRS